MDESFPCPRCGTNAWTDCSHRKAVGTRPVHVDEPDRRETQVKASGGGRYRIPSGGQGRNFRRVRD